MKTTPKLVGAFVLGLICARSVQIGQDARLPAISPPPAHAGGEKRALHGAAALLAASVLMDSAIEHYRGSFENPGMYAPLISSSLALFSGAEGAATTHPSLRLVRRSSYQMAVLAGLAGTAFHFYDVFRRPGGFGWLNLFYGAPLGAPAALTISGLLGLCGEELGDATPAERRLLRGYSAGRVIAVLTSVALAGTVAEVSLLHFRGAFQNPFMWAPLTLPPVASGLMAKAAAERPARRYLLTRNLALADGRARLRGDGFSRLWRLARDGRMAELEPKRARRPSSARAAELLRAFDRVAFRPFAAGRRSTALEQTG